MSHPVRLLGSLEHFGALPAKQRPTESEVAEGALRIREEFARVVAHVGHKQSAAELGTQESTLSHMLAGRGSRYLRLDWAEWGVENAPDAEFTQSLVVKGGWTVVRIPIMTAEEKILRLEATLKHHFNPELAEALLERAYRR